jgi:hypothetical protein
MALRQVLYGSSAVRPMTQAEIDVILEQARRRNTETGITGILFYLDGNFLQLLEGEEPALSEIFSRIRLDTRHLNLIKMLDGPIEQRSFAASPMAFRSIYDNELEENPDLFVQSNGRWSLREGAGVGEQLKILIETFLMVNYTRSHDRLEGRNS